MEERKESGGNALTPARIRCLIAILRCSEGESELTSRRLAQALHIRPPSVCRLLDALGEMGLVAREYYGRVELTRAGAAAAVHWARRVALLRRAMTLRLGLEGEQGETAALYFAGTLPEESQLRMLGCMTERNRNREETP